MTDLELVHETIRDLWSIQLSDDAPEDQHESLHIYKQYFLHSGKYVFTHDMLLMLSCEEL